MTGRIKLSHLRILKLDLSVKQSSLDMRVDNMSVALDEGNSSGEAAETRLECLCSD